MHPVASNSPIQGVIFDFGSTLAINRTPWPTIIQNGALALTSFLRDAGLVLPDDFDERWITMLRTAVRQADHDGAERSADDTLSAWLGSQDCSDPRGSSFALDVRFVRQATDCYFSAEDAARAVAPGAVSLLAKLKALGYRVALLSNTNGGRWVHKWSDRFGFRPYVDAVITSDEIGYRKPRPEAFTATLKRIGLDDPTRAVMVGDTFAQDIVGAHALGMRTVQVALAADANLGQPPLSTSPAEIVPSDYFEARPDAVITDLLALIPILEGWQVHD